MKMSFFRRHFIYIQVFPASPAALAISLIAALTGCTSNAAQCGGQIFPDHAGDEALAVVKKAEADSKTFCAASDAGCDFTVARSKQGWTVAVSRMFAVDGMCASRIGDEKYYSYDESGSLIRVIDGL